MKNYQITVVMPVFNGENSIIKSIESLKAQTFNKWCCIIVNDGSTDNTKQILDNLQDERFTIIHFKENKGRPIARQIALENVKTPYMCMLDADDWYYPNKLKTQFEFMEANKHVTLLSTAIGVVNKQNILYTVLAPFKSSKSLKFYDYLNYQQIPHASSIIRVSDIGDLKFNSLLKLGQDQDFLRRLLLNKDYAFLDDITYIYHRDDSFSLKKYIMSKRFGITSIKSLNISMLKKCKVIVTNYIKILFMIAINFLGAKKYYMKNTGRKPTISEIEVFNNISNLLLNN